MAHDDAVVASGRKFAIVLAVFQVIFIVLFGVFGRYHQDARPPAPAPTDANAVVVAKNAPLDTPAVYAPDSALRDFYPSKHSYNYFSKFQNYFNEFIYIEIQIHQIYG